MNIVSSLAESAYTSLGFFWKAAWAFVMGYGISAMIQAFVPKQRLIRYMGEADAQSVSLSTIFGMISSSCSFAALAAARSLLSKGASFVAGVAFMFASTNLVIELGILIFIFLGWQYLLAEVIGGLLLIAISSIIIKAIHPAKMIDELRDRLDEMSDSDDDFDPWQRITSFDGWKRVGFHFVDEWEMVWSEILIGFTVAGMVAVFVPQAFWEAIFLSNAESIPAWLVAVENALVGPLVAAMTFIGSMGNIPLATVLSSNGVLFAGIIAFIYSDLMVPPLIVINRKYYGTKVAFFIAGVMYASIVATALILQALFAGIGIVPESQRAIKETVRISMDYTFYLNIVFAIATIILVWLYIKFKKSDLEAGMEMEGASALKKTIATVCAVYLVIGIPLHLLLN